MFAIFVNRNVGSEVARKFFFSANPVILALLLVAHQASAEDVRRSGRRLVPSPPVQDLYDDFDGHGAYRAVDNSHLAISGELSADLWAGDANVVPSSALTSDSTEHGNVAVLELTGDDTYRSLDLVNPENITFQDCGSFSADFFVPSGSVPTGFDGGIAINAWLPEYELDPYWLAIMSFYKHESGSLRLGFGWKNLADGIWRSETQGVRYDTWYNLKIDLRKVRRESVKISFYIDESLVWSGILEESAALLDPNRMVWGPARQFVLSRSDTNEPAELIIDNVRAESQRISLNRAAPITVSQGEQVRMTLEGKGFSEDSLPYSTIWGLLFFDVVRPNKSTIVATAVAHPNAPVGEREIAVTAGPGTRSNSLPIEILPGDAMNSVGGRVELYDDFDGNGGYHPLDDNHLATDGEISPELWSTFGEVDVVAAVEGVGDSIDHSNVAKLSVTGDSEDWSSLILQNPRQVPMEMFGSFSVNAFIPQSDSVQHRDVSIKYRVWIPELESGWEVGVSLSRGEDGSVWIGGGWWDVISGQELWEGFTGETERWYELRMDFAVIDNTRLLVSLFIDDILLLTGIPEQSEILLDPARISEPTRTIDFWTNNPGGEALAYIDDVHAVYERLVLSEISSTSGEQGKRQRVTITGDGFRDGVVPFATEWGVSFVKLRVIDPQTMMATALVDPLAPIGDREVMVGVPGATYSKPLVFSIEPNTGNKDYSQAFGLYDDFDGNGAEQLDGNQLAEEGSLSEELWTSSDACLAPDLVAADTELGEADTDDHRTILKLTKDFDAGDCGRLYFDHPEGMTFREFKSWSADFRVPRGATAPRTGGALDFHSGGVDGGLSWYAIFDISGNNDPPGWLNLTAHCNNRDRPYQWYRTLRSVEFDTWYNLRMDIVVIDDESMRLDFFLDGRLVAHESPYEAPIILGEQKSGGRMIDGAYHPEEERNGIYSFYLDNVYAVYNLED